jgi:hypothetical protein
MNNLTMRNDKLLQKRFNVLKAEADKKYADDPEMAKQVKGTLSTTALVVSGIWAEFYGEFKYDSPWIMSSMGNSTPFIKSFSNKHLKNVVLQDLPNDVITLFVIPEINRIEIIIGTTSVAVIKIDDTNVHVSFTKDKKFELSKFVEEHVKAALVKINRLIEMTDGVFNNHQTDTEEDDESDIDE